MTAIFAVVGAALIAVANYDALVTTVAVGSGSRPLTEHVARGLRKVLRRVPRALPAGGPVVVLATVGVWITLLWAGYTVFTLGNGGYTPAVGWWEMFTVIATLNGLFVATLASTYLVPVVSAVVERPPGRSGRWRCWTRSSSWSTRVYVADEPPPLPDIGELAAHGVPVSDARVLEAAAADISERRGHLAALIHTAAGKWPNSAAQRDAAPRADEAAAA